MRAEFVIKDEWHLIIYCAWCHEVNAVWGSPFPGRIFQMAACWQCARAQEDGKI